MSIHTTGPVPDDPFELLKQLNPVPDPSVLSTASQGHLDEILASILASDPKHSTLVVLPSARQRRRRRAVGALAVAAALAAAAFTWVVTRHASDPLSIGCHAEFSLDGDRTQVDPDGRDPRDLCSEAWSNGQVKRSESTAPPLVVCVHRSGSFAVFPGGPGRVCSRLGLAEPTPDDHLDDGPSDVATIGKLHQELVQAFLTSGCVAPSDARQLIRAGLRRHHLTDWQIEAPDGFPTDRPCASLAFDPAAKTIRVVPVPRPPQSG